MRVVELKSKVGIQYKNIKTIMAKQDPGLGWNLSFRKAPVLKVTNWKQLRVSVIFVRSVNLHLKVFFE